MRESWQGMVDDRADEDGLRVRRDIYSDSAIFERERETLFEGGWIYLAHETQLPDKHDYVTVAAGRRPLVIMRGADGTLRAFHNACPHKGAMICPLDRGNGALHICPYHSWSFGSDGRNRAIKAKAQGAYTTAFLAERHDLVPVAEFSNYRGFLFGSLSHNVPSLQNFLGDARVFIDMFVDQSPLGLELVPGQSTFTYEGNWKHQLENCSDAYHVTSVHPTYLKVAQNRAKEQVDDQIGGIWNRTDTMLNGDGNAAQSGTFSFKHGHTVTWSAGEATPSHPLYDRRDELMARLGAVQAKWMFYARNLTIFPNLQIVDNFSSQIRVLRPLGPGRTEMATWCVGPKGEGPAARFQRLRQYEDFFMPSGMATPDDLSVYQDCQITGNGARESWLGFDRGVARQEGQPNGQARELSITPHHCTQGSAASGDETLMHNYYRAWLERMDRPLEEAPELVPGCAP